MGQLGNIVVAEHIEHTEGIEGTVGIEGIGDSEGTEGCSGKVVQEGSGPIADSGVETRADSVEEGQILQRAWTDSAGEGGNQQAASAHQCTHRPAGSS